MRFLVSSDLHGKISAFQNYAYLLQSDAFDAGIIAGDLLDDGVPDEEMAEVFQNTDLSPDDFLPELQFEDETTSEYMDRLLGKLHTPEGPFVRANQYKEDKLRKLLCSAEKPVYVICGNHDQTMWIDGGCIVNVHNRRVEVGAVNLVGYRWTNLDRSESDRIRDVSALRGMIDSSTILITHEPPYGILDGTLGAPMRNGPISIQNCHFGSAHLLNLSQETVPKFHVFGHVHSQFGVHGAFINAAYPHRRAFLGLDVCSSEVTIIDEVDMERSGGCG